MGKFRLSAVSVSPARPLLGCLMVLLASAGVPAHAASNQVSAVVHIHITVVSSVEVPAPRPTATNPTESITYDLRPSSALRMSSQVTIHQISTSGPATGVKTGGKAANGDVLETTTVVPE